MKLAKSQQCGETMAALAGMYDFINAMVKPEERARLDQFLSDQELEAGALSEGIGALVKDYAGRPTERPSSSRSGSTSTGQSLRADSPSPDTARVVNLSPKAGRSAAS
jgi:hypothetical protein